MEELLLALVIWIGHLIAKAYRRVADWLRGGAGRIEPAERPSLAAPAAQMDPYRAQREALASRATRLREQSEALGRDLGNAPETAAIRRALEVDVAPLGEEARRALAQIPPGAAGVVGMERLAERLEQLERMVKFLAWAAAQRRRAPDRSLQAADRLAQALMGPLARAILGALEEGARPPVPLAFRGSRALFPAGLPSRTSLAPLALPETFPADPLHFAVLAHELGRDLLERVPGLRWEIRSRLGLPDRYPVPFAFRGYFGSEEIYQPWGAWLEVAFGDLVGAMLLGPAYGWALLATLGRPEQPALAAQVSTTREGAFYAPSPPPHLRLVFVQGALITLGFEKDALGVAQRWEELHGGGPLALHVPSRLQGYMAAPLGPFEQMAGRLAEVLLEEPFDALGGRSLIGMEGVAFSAADEGRAEALAVALARDGAPTAEADPRLRLVAAILARAQSAARAERLARWLLEGVRPGAEALATRPSVAGPRPASEDRGSEFRDALVLDAMLSRRRFGEPLPARWRP